MALDLTALKSGIKAALDAAAAEEDPANKDAALQALADGIGDAVDTFVKSGTVATTVTTVVTGTLPTGPVAAVGAGTGTGSMT